MNTQNNVVLAQQKKSKVTLSQRAKHGLDYVKGGIFVVSAWAVTVSANAGMFDEQYTKFNEEMSSALSSITGMFGVAFSVLIMLAIWRYTKRGANSA